VLRDPARKEAVMAKGSYTVFVLTDAASPPRKLHISKSVAGMLASVTAVAFLGFTFFVYEYVNLNVRMLELKQLRREAGQQNVMAEKIRQLEGEVSKVRELDRRLRVAIGLDKSEARPAILAQGGADAGARNALRDAVVQRTGRLMDWVGGDLTTLAQEIASREQSLRELQTHLDQKTAILAATPTILPTKGLVTAGYGYRKSPFTGKREFHEGMDIAALHGTPVVATADGIVRFAGPAATYGNVVFIDHGHGFATAYGHNSTIRVHARQRVRRGDIIAYVGNTGRTTGPHVHYEVHVDGVPSNPMKYAVDNTGITFAVATDPDSSS
jgi:murein DD-endopeptidase MepM/ murein hydrolase activator NlpD